jgi:O-antigen/teichoic acid export membrane protein
MNLARKVFSDAAFTSIRSIVSLLRGIVVLPLITKLLGEGSYGIWVTILSFVGLLGSVGGLHLHGSLIRYESQEIRDNQTYSDVLFLAIITGVVLAVSVSVVGVTIDLSVFFEDEIGSYMLLILIVAFLLLSNKIFRINVNFPRSKGYVKHYDLILIIRGACETLLLAIVFLFGGGILVALAALSGFLIIINMGIFAFISSRYMIPFPNPSNFEQYIRYGIPMIPKEVSSSLLSHTDKYLLIYFLNPSAVGIYAAAKGVSSPIVTLSKIFDPTLYTTISNAWDEKKFDEISSAYHSIFRFYSILGIPSVLGMVLLSEPLLNVLSTTAIAQRGKILVPIFIFGYFLKGYDNSIRYILTSAERTEIIGAAVMITVIVNVVLNLALIPEFGLLGAAVATLSSHVLLFAIILYYSFSEVTIKIPALTIGRSLTAAVVMGLLLLLVIPPISAYAKLIIYPTIGAAIYFIILFFLGEFSKSEKARFKSAIFEFFSLN